MSDRPILDDAVIHRLEALGGAEFVAQMIDIFMDQAPRRVDAALHAARARNLDAVGGAAHSLVSTAGHLGAARLLRLAEALERAAEAQAWDAVARLLPALGPTLEEARSALEALRPQASA